MSTHPDPKNVLPVTRMLLLGLSLAALWVTGCTQIVAPIDAIPADRVPKELLVQPTTTRSIDFARLRRPPEKMYLLDKGDVLGIFIDGVLGQVDEAPPVQLAPLNSDLPPALGYPVPIRDDGTLPLPLIPPIFVKGLTIQEAETAIKRAYSEAGVLTANLEEPDNDNAEKNAGDDEDSQEEPKTKKGGIDEIRTIVTLMKERTYRVLVIRQDNLAAGLNNDVSQGLSVQRTVSAGLGQVLQLEEGKNDVLQALSLTGGLPGFRAKNEVKIYRGGNEQDYAEKDRKILEHYQTHLADRSPCSIPPKMVGVNNETIRIPLRLRPDEVPTFQPSDIILGDGDIIVVESREKEVFYTGGKLGGGEYPLPRDYDLDVLTAMAIAKQGFGALGERGGGGGGGGLGGQSATIEPGQLIVLRKLPGNQQIAIEVDVTKAINDPRSRILVKAGDTLILRHKPAEEILNFGMGTFFTFGISELFR